MKHHVTMGLLFFVAANIAHAKDLSNETSKEQKPWNNKRAAVALTYDDALNVHLDTVVPALDARGFKGTFYITVSSEPFSKRIVDWRKTAQAGHELGNHTLFHPCIGGPNRTWVKPENDLSTWSMERLLGNIKTANTTLEAVDGKTQRTLAYTCGDTQVGPNKTTFIKELEPLVTGARMAWGDPQSKTKVASNVYTINAYMVNNDTAKAMKALVDNAIKEKKLLVFLFHGVGGEHDINVSSEAHAELLAYLAKKQNKIWIAPMVDIVNYLKNDTKQKP